MRWTLHLLIAIAVLCCGLHIGEPSELPGGPADRQIETLHRHASDDGRGARGLTGSEAGHSHCPIAIDQQATPIGCATPGEHLMFAEAPIALPSRAEAPLLEPPLA